MQMGVHYSNFSHPQFSQRLPGLLMDSAKAADDLGFAQFTVMDHWFQMEQLGGPDEPMLEGYTTLGFLAAVTERIRLGLLVTGVTYRHPGLLAKTVTTLDVLSQSRAMLGIGAAWYDREHAGLGVPFPSTSERFERLEETLQIVRQMWAGDRSAYAGTHYQLDEPVLVPPPPGRTPPIMIGGNGERKTLRLVAKYADACNLFGQSPALIAHKLEVLRGHCEDAGTDYDAIEKTIILGADPLTDPQGFIVDMGGYAELGIDMVICGPPGDDPVAWVDQVGRTILPGLADLQD